jgi:chemotaxis protein MotA
MFAIIGILVVIGAIVGGYLFEGGAMGVLWQPAELIIIFGAAIGILVLGTPQKILAALSARVMQVFKGSGIAKAAYLELLKLQFEVYSVIRKGGMLALENDVAEPEKSEIFKKYPGFLRNHHAVTFFCDSLRLLIDGAEPGEVEHVMHTDLATHHEEANLPAGVISKVADALPGMGIVAAVLGIVIAMQHLDGPASELGHKVGAALIGTFLGILMSYGFFQPIAANIEHITRDESKYLQCLMVGLVSYAGGTSPAVAVEQARRVVYAADRPSAQELDAALNEIKSSIKG